jgi:hypothetical protein
VVVSIGTLPFAGHHWQRIAFGGDFSIPPLTLLDPGGRALDHIPQLTPPVVQWGGLRRKHVTSTDHSLRCRSPVYQLLSSLWCYHRSPALGIELFLLLQGTVPNVAWGQDTDHGPRYSGRKITESLGNVTVRGGKRWKEQGGSTIVSGHLAWKYLPQ